MLLWLHFIRSFRFRRQVTPSSSKYTYTQFFVSEIYFAQGMDSSSLRTFEVDTSDSVPSSGIFLKKFKPAEKKNQTSDNLSSFDVRALTHFHPDPVEAVEFKFHFFPPYHQIHYFDFWTTFQRLS